MKASEGELAALKGELVDQIERAMATLKRGKACGGSVLDDEARVELDRLEGLIGQWREAREGLGPSWAITELAGAREVLSEYDKVVDALRAENARLREALTEALER